MTNSIKIHITPFSALFLDRDGVINQRPVNDYVRNFKSFVILPGVLEALASLDKHFSKIVIVTNQQGVGKGLMSQTELDSIHKNMLDEIQQSNGRIDRIYCCTDLKTKADTCRKPNIQMALAAKQDFPEIDFKHSIMVGDTNSDMLFGKNAGMLTVLIGNETVTTTPNFNFDSLLAFSNALNNN